VEHRLKLARAMALPENQGCDHCVETLTARLAGQEGITRAHQDEEGLLCLHYQEESWEDERLARAVRLLGAQVQRDYQRRQWAVTGMDCGSCVRVVEEGLASLPGVVAVQANVATGKVSVEFQEDLTSAEKVRARLADLGHPVREAAGPARAAQEEPFWLRWQRRLLAREWRPWVMGVLLVLLSVVASLAGWEAWVAELALVLAVAVGASDIARNGIRQLVTTRRLSVDFLMTIAAAGALLLGEYAEGAAVVLLFVLGERLEGVTMERARRSIRSLMALAPDRASRLLADDSLEEVDVAELEVGERLLVRPGERIPMDGVVIEGESAVDQSPITGESIPVRRVMGDELFAGSINGRGALEMRVTHRAQDTTLARVIAMVEEAQGRRAPVLRLVDRFAEWYTPAVVVGALLVALLPPLFLGWAWATSIHRALVLLVISCPCALVISTPVSIIAAVTNAARQGVLIKGGAYLEALGELKVIAFDKTGTLTQGRPVVTDIVPFDDDITPEALLALAAAVEQRSEHPLAAAVTRAAEERGLTMLPVEGFQAVAGRGGTGGGAPRAHR
jgi:Zn2+/Cd2+-exporting ATPase